MSPSKTIAEQDVETLRVYRNDTNPQMSVVSEKCVYTDVAEEIQVNDLPYHGFDESVTFQNCQLEMMMNVVTGSVYVNIRT